MKNKLYRVLWAVLYVATAAGFAGCSSQWENEAFGGQKGLSVVTRADGGDSGSDGEEVVFMADAYVFSSGRLRDRKEKLQLVLGKPVLLSGIEYAEGDHMYFFSSADEHGKLGDVKTEEELLECRGTENLQGDVPEFFTGMIQIDSQREELVLKRGISRLNIELAGDEIRVQSVTLDGVCPTGYLFAQTEAPDCTDVKKVRMKRDLSGIAPIGGKYYDGVFHLYEQWSKEALPVEIVLTHHGERKVVKGELPGRLERNKIYTLRLSAKDVVIVKVEVADWGLGEDIDMSPNFKHEIVAVAEDCVLSTGASLNEEGNELTLPYFGGKQLVAFSGDSDLEFELEGEGKELLTVTPALVSEGGFQLQNRFWVESPYQTQEHGACRVKMKLRQKGSESYLNEMDIVLPENVNRFYKDAGFGQKMDFKGNVCDFNRYIDGTLGYLEVPEGSRVTVKNGNWIRLDEVVMEGRQVYAIEGGYKPNDPEADGREQVAQVVVTHPEGSLLPESETFELKRRNWGLPVVEVNGMYWCRYNLRGNSRGFEDQIPYCYGTGQDPVVNLADFLTECGMKGEICYPSLELCFPALVPVDSVTSVRFYTMLGDGYQGHNPVGLAFKPDPGVNSFTGLLNNNYHYWGYRDNLWPEDDTNLVPDSCMVPDGYKIPEPADFWALLNADNIGFGPATESQDFGDLDNKDFFRRINRKEVAVGGKTMVHELIVIPPMPFTGIGAAKESYFCYLIAEKGREENPLVLMGHPSQFKLKGQGGQNYITSNVLAFVMRNKERKVWFLDGSDTGNVRFKLGAYASPEKVAKAIRCVKTPVKYIIP